MTDLKKGVPKDDDAENKIRIHIEVEMDDDGDWNIGAVDEEGKPTSLPDPEILAAVLRYVTDSFIDYFVEYDDEEVDDGEGDGEGDSEC